MPKETILYEILGVSPDTPENEIIIAYYQLAEKFHPHNLKNADDQDEEKFNNIKFAYEVLSDEKKEISTTKTA